MKRGEIRHGALHLRRHAVARLVLPLAMAALLAACSSGGGDKRSGSLFGGQQDKGQAAAGLQTTSPGAGTAPTTSAAATAAPTVAARATTAPTAPAAAAQGGGNPASFEPCSLVTRQEAAAAVGEAVGDGESIGPISQPLGGLTVMVYHCGYESPTTVHKVEFDVWRAPSSAAAQVRQTFDAVCRQANKERLSGFGDVACWYDASYKELSLVKGATYFNIRVSAGANIDPGEVVKTVAKKILERSP